jgi:hypothetical protein
VRDAETNLTQSNIKIAEALDVDPSELVDHQ